MIFLLDCASTGDQLEEQYNNGDDQQQVDEPAGDVEGKAQQPKNEQNYKDCPEHDRSPLPLAWGLRLVNCRRDDDARKSLAGLLSRIAQRRCNRSWRGELTMLSAQKRNELGNLVRGESFGKRWHLLTTMRDLVADLIRGEALSHGVQGGPFLSAETGGAVAIGASLIAKENGSGLFRFVGRKARRRVNRETEECGQGQGCAQPRELFHRRRY